MTDSNHASTGTSVVFLNRFYWPATAATGQMLTDLAEDLVEQGWRVTVITTRSGYAPGDACPSGEEVRNGVRILRVNSTRFGQGGALGRIVDYLTYLVGAFVRLLCVAKPDVVVAMSDPPFLLAPAVVAGKLRGVRTVYWVQDIYPQLAGKLGVLRVGGLAYRVLCGVKRWLHGACEGIVTLGPRMSERMIESGACPQRIKQVHNWGCARAIHPLPSAANPFLVRHGLQDKFVVLYSGNAGRGHTFDAVIEAMRRLKDDSETIFLFIGGGAKLASIRDAAEREGLANVRFLDYVPRSELKYSLSAASVSLVTERPETSGLLVPSKTYGILASGRPLLFVGCERSDVAAVVRETGCGVIVAPDDPTTLVATLRRFKFAPEEAREMGRLGRRAAEEIYDRRYATSRWADAVTELLRHGSEAPSRDVGRAAHGRFGKAAMLTAPDSMAALVRPSLGHALPTTPLGR